MLGADLVGFHTYDYARHFISSVSRIKDVEINFNEISFGNRIIKVDSFPMGIDYDKYHNAALDHDKYPEENKSELMKNLDFHNKSNEESKLILPSTEWIIPREFLTELNLSNIS